MRLSGKTAVVTDAGSPAGREIASAFEAAGVTVLVLDPLHLTADIASKVDIAVFVHAQPVASAPITTCAVADFDLAIADGPMAFFRLLRMVLPDMAGRGHGAVLATSSIAALNGLRGRPADVASSHAILGLVRSAALEVAPRGVTINAVLHDGDAARADTVAEIVLFLCGVDARNVTGAHFVVDAGASASWSSLGPPQPVA